MADSEHLRTAPAALLQSPEFWESFVESVPDLLVLVDRSANILFVNHAPAGMSRGSVLGTSVLDFVPEGSRAPLRDSLAKIFEGSQPRRREQEGLLADGTSVWYSTHTSPVMHNGEVVAAVIVARDITERRRAQLNLVESEARFRTLVENAPEAIVVFDMDVGRFVDANRHACELFEMPRASLLHSSPFDLSPQRQPDGRLSSVVAREYLTQALAGKVPSFEWVHLSATGRERRCEVRLVRLPSERPLIRGSIIDRTEQMRLDEQMAEWQKMDALGQLAAGIAHDFNNVLTVVGAAAQTLEEMAVLPDDLADEIRAIRVETARGAALATQLLAYSRHQALPPEKLNLNDVIHSIAFTLRRVIPNGIELTEQLHADAAIVLMHRSQAEQILMNLVLNARDAINGKGAITISTECAGNGSVLLRVADTGSGMSEELRKRSVEPFFSTKALGKGTGLGLSTVNTIVKNAGGQLSIESTIGEGTTVTVSLPATRSTAT